MNQQTGPMMNPNFKKCAQPGCENEFSGRSLQKFCRQHSQQRVRRTGNAEYQLRNTVNGSIQSDQIPQVYLLANILNDIVFRTLMENHAIKREFLISAIKLILEQSPEAIRDVAYQRYGSMPVTFEDGRPVVMLKNGVTVDAESAQTWLIWGIDNRKQLASIRKTSAPKYRKAAELQKIKEFVKKTGKKKSFPTEQLELF